MIWLARGWCLRGWFLDPETAAPNHVSARSRRATSIAIWPLISTQAPRREELQTTATMANRGYDVVVDVDQEVCMPPESTQIWTRLSAHPHEAAPIVDSQTDHIAGRPRPHRSPRRPRISQLQYALIPLRTISINSDKQILKTQPRAAAQKPIRNRRPSSRNPQPPPPPARANTSSGRSPSTRKPSMSILLRVCADVSQQSTRAPTSSMCLKGTLISTALFGSPQQSLSYFS